MTSSFSKLRFINQCELGLSILAAIPALGMVPAGCKVGMGSCQVIGGAASFTLSKMCCSCVDNPKRLANKSCVHIQHGLANVGIGLIEGIPIVGAVLLIIRVGKAFWAMTKYNDAITSKNKPLIYTQESEFKFMPYGTIEALDICVESATGNKTQAFANKLNSFWEGGRQGDYISRKQVKAWAREVCRSDASV